MTSARTCPVVWLLVLVASPIVSSSHAAAQAPTEGGKYALLVGVRQYAKDELRALPYTESDVEALAQVLHDAGYAKSNLVLMTQKTGAADTDLLPTAANIRTQLKLLLQARRPGDSVLVALAGHGVQYVGDKENYFCPADARLANRKGTLLPLGEVYKTLAACKADFKLLLVDACRNDPLVDQSRALPEVQLASEYRPVIQPPGGVAALFSCSAGQKAFENSKLKHGVFFHFVIEGLRGAADANKDRQITLSELQEYVQVQVPDFVRAEFSVLQTPELRGTVRGSVMLLRVNFGRAALAVVEQARGLIERKQYDKALTTLEEALRLDGKLAAAYIQRGTAYFFKKDYMRALADATRALALAPNNAEAHFLRGRLYMADRDDDRALASYAEAIRLDPKFTMAYIGRGNRYLHKREFGNAQAEYEAVLRIKPEDALAMAGLGYVYMGKGNLDRAINACTEALRRDPTCLTAYEGRGRAYAQKKDYDRALADFTAILRLDPGQAWAYYQRGDIYRLKKDYDTAIADYTDAIRLNPTFAVCYRQRAAAYSGKKDYEHALTDCTEAIRQAPKDAQSYFARGTVYCNKRAYDLAIADYTRALDLGPQTALMYSWRGYAYLEKKAYDQAISDCTESIRLDPDTNPAPYHNRGLAFAARRERQRAIADYTEALRIAPRYVRVLRSRGIQYFFLKDYAHALADYTEALRLAPSDAWTLNERGRVYFVQKDYNRAMTDFAAALRHDARYRPAHYNRGLILLLHTKDYDGSIAAFTEAIRLRSSANAFNDRGAAYAHKKDWPRAIADYTEAIRLNPNLRVAYSNRARAYRATGEPTRAEADEATARRLANRR